MIYLKLVLHPKFRHFFSCRQQNKIFFHKKTLFDALTYIKTCYIAENVAFFFVFCNLNVTLHHKMSNQVRKQKTYTI